MLTLVVPIYNMEKYLARCVDSLLGQTCRDFEIILVDDGSTDFSGTLCDSYAARYPELVRVIHKPNGGPSSARNAGLDAARGDFVTFPDPDDWVEPDYVGSFLRLQQEYPADMTCVGYYVDNGDFVQRIGDERAPYRMTGPEARRGLLLPPSLQGFSWSKLYRMELIRRHSLRFPEDIHITEDIHFAYHYLSHCSEVCYAPSARCYHYCQTEDSITAHRYSPKKLDVFRVMECIQKDCSGTDEKLARAAADNSCTTAVNLIWMLVNSRQNAPEDLKYLRDQIRRTLPRYLHSGQYGFGRKVQAVLALMSPRLYALLKNAVHQKKRLPGRKEC